MYCHSYVIFTLYIFDCVGCGYVSKIERIGMNFFFFRRLYLFHFVQRKQSSYISDATSIQKVISTEKVRRRATKGKKK